MDEKKQAGVSSGMMILGMHRSGTSALSHALGIAGADVGARVLGASQGNEGGHWEDAFAVETNERLMAALGMQWHEPFALPDNWLQSAPAREALRDITGYVQGNRRKHRLWSAKDPRLCLLGDLWVEAAAGAGVPLGAVLMIRHPLEVAESLMVRDGIAIGRGLLLWLEYTLSSLRIAGRMPSVVIEYGRLLEDWPGSLARIVALPGAGVLAEDAASVQAVARILNPGKRHHRQPDDVPLPGLIAELWSALSASAAGRASGQDLQSLASKADGIAELLRPMLAEWRVTEHKLWERVARAENTGDHSSVVQADVAMLSDKIDNSHVSLLTAITEDIRRMQEMTARAMNDAVALEKKAEIANEIAPKVGLLDETVKLLIPQFASFNDVLSNQIRSSMEMASHAAVELVAADDELRKLRTQAVRAGELEGGLAAATRELEVLRPLAAAAEQAFDERTKAQVELEALRPLAAAAEQAFDERARAQAELEVLRPLAAAVEQAFDERAKAQAELEKAQRDINALFQEQERLRDRARQLDLLLSSASWRWTRPLRLFKRLLTGRMADSDRVRIRQILGLKTKAHSGLQVASAAAAVGGNDMAPVQLAAPREGLPDVYVWAVIDWHFRYQRPQHLALALAEKGHRVFYISNNFVDSREPGYVLDPLNVNGRLFQVHLHLQGAPSIYGAMPDSAQQEAMLDSLARLLALTAHPSSISIVQHPFWMDIARSVPNVRVVYDCMDHHAGFENNASSILDGEHRLVREADLVIVTSEWLEKEIGAQARATSVIRNAGEYAFFEQRPAQVFRDRSGRRVIGYYGAIAEWFDVELVRRVAQAYPDCLVVLVGHDTAGASASLASVDNVMFTGEVAYRELPYWLHGFNVCLLPFRVIPLTLATNPVKVYEYLSAGKPTVAVDLPEMMQFEGLVHVAADADAFVRLVGDALAESDPIPAQERKRFASQQTWAHRAEALDQALDSLREPRISVIVLTYNNLAFTEACLFSLESYSDYSNLEIIVVDNASTDGSRDWLSAWVEEPSPAGHLRRLILNDGNLGFSAGNNVGLRVATGEYLVILNNDTYVTPGWARTLRNHLVRNPAIGIVGPVTNNIGNEAKLDIHYADMAEMIARSAAYTRAHPGRTLRIGTAAFFCVAMRRGVYLQVGDMDEDFGVGFFEDDDYCRRVEKHGLEIACAEDVFVHHHLSASFDALKAEKKQELFERNKAIYEAKWGKWIPHSYR